MMVEPGQVRAGGGVVVREGRIAVVHRPRYDDWSLPKGKARESESFEAAAVREVEEETGLRCVLEVELTPNRYPDARGRPKLVRWWRMRVESETAFSVDDEVDELRWLSRDEAQRLLSYEHDRALVNEALTRP